MVTSQLRILLCEGFWPVGKLYTWIWGWLFASLSVCWVSAATWLPTPTDVFVGGQEGYPAYRIPSLLVTTNRTLLAFVEGRQSRNDHAENDILLKRSLDDGKTWSGLKVVAEAGSNSLNNPTAVLLPKTGRVLLMYQFYAKGFGEYKAAPGLEGPHVCRTYLTQSDDDGVTWSNPREITSSVKRPTRIVSTATGPGIGIQLERGKYAGRILMPFNEGVSRKWDVYAAMSDDGGQTWRYGDLAPNPTKGYANEVQFVELSDGRVMLNARNQAGDKRRKIAISDDGGQTWSPLEVSTLIESECQASILRHQAGTEPAQAVFLFSNPATEIGRTNGTIRLSRDEGKTWPVSRVLYTGGFAYSCLATLRDGSIGCLFERDGYKEVSFIRFTLAEVEGK